MIYKKLKNQLPYLVLLFLLIGCKKDKTDDFAPIENWTKSSTGISQSLNDLHFYNNQFGIVSGDFGTILKTTDGGSTWASLNSPTNQTFLAAFTLSEKDLFVARLGLFKSNNAGASFAEIGNTSSFGSSIRGIHFLDSLLGVITK